MAATERGRRRPSPFPARCHDPIDGRSVAAPEAPPAAAGAFLCPPQFPERRLRPMTSTPRTESEAMAQVRTEIGGLRTGLSTRLREVRTELVAAGVDVNAFLATTPLFDGPGPDALAAGTVAADARLFRSAVELIRSIPFTAGGEACQIGPWDPLVDRILLQHCVPGAFHLFDRGFDHLDPAVRDDRSIHLHEGNPAENVLTLADESLDYALVDGTVSYADAERLFAALLPKVKPGGYVHVRNYTVWSVFSGIPFGVASVVNRLANRGAACVVGFAPNPFGYHQILLRKADAVPTHAAAGRMHSPLEAPTPDGPPRGTREPGTWAGFDAFLSDFRARESRPPAILDWTAEGALAGAFPEIPVFSPGVTDKGLLPSIDQSVDVGAIPPGDPVRMAEARRVATALVAEIGPVAPDGTVPIALHPLTTVVLPVASPAAPPRRQQRPPAHRRSLLSSPPL
ncbi:MAG: class I SAM-dependent methyltransferase, partial [Planctomycetaceae bacterium]